MFKYVDLACKKGNALNVARKQASRRGLPVAKPAECLGIDMQASYREPIEKAGYQFVCARVDSDDCPWHPADVYLAWNSLEHMANLEAAKEVLAKMFEAARKCVWLLLPSFEDETLARLRKIGYEFNWVAWKCHRAHVQVKHVDEVAKQFASRISCRRLAPKWPFYRCGKHLRPLPDCEQKPQTFKPPIYGAAEVLFFLR